MRNIAYVIDSKLFAALTTSMEKKRRAAILLFFPENPTRHTYTTTYDNHE
jgi:hypothetical protein